MKKKAFSMTELLFAMAIAGSLSAIALNASSSVIKDDSFLSDTAMQNLVKVSVEKHLNDVLKMGNSVVTNYKDGIFKAVVINDEEDCLDVKIYRRDTEKLVAKSLMCDSINFEIEYVKDDEAM